ncbi:hypothetical protein FHS76_000006 [Ochrobactrum daejeonense]|uniref:Uncharacterized protein n=1 Tax=Brucella daejeonensis TaxID=659015 RepID=A0A7W9EJF4_9HYPH|nr:hypothetical protein [Brucella daejeonensis]MBB5700168.1 hypothetical protein [Brucella daejeonensis]NKB78524.1 hypothetical protein [Brucella daejeonensis]
MKLTKQQIDKMHSLRSELTKVRCWLTGYHAGSKTNVGIPGEDSLRQTIMLIDEIAGRQALKGGE